MTVKATVTVRDLTLGYRRSAPVVHNLSTEFFPGMTALAGSNGSGKSTVLKAIAGHLLPLGGEVTLLGRCALSKEAIGLRTVVPSQAALIPSLTVRDHVYLVAKANGLTLPTLMARLEKYELMEWIDAPCAELSSGNQQRAWWALGTAVRRTILLVDEPFTAVDSDGVHLMVRELNAWATSGEHTIIIVAHEPPDDLRPSATVTMSEGATID